MYVVMCGWGIATFSYGKPSKKNQWYLDTVDKQADLWQRIFILAMWSNKLRAVIT